MHLALFSLSHSLSAALCVGCSVIGTTLVRALRRSTFLSLSLSSSRPDLNIYICVYSLYIQEYIGGGGQLGYRTRLEPLFARPSPCQVDAFCYDSSALSTFSSLFASSQPRVLAFSLWQDRQMLTTLYFFGLVGPLPPVAIRTAGVGGDPIRAIRYLQYISYIVYYTQY